MKKGLEAFSDHMQTLTHASYQVGMLACCVFLMLILDMKTKKYS